MKKRLKNIGFIFFTALLIIVFALPDSTILAHAQQTDEEKMVDIVVRYHDTVPNEEDLDPAYENVNTLSILPIQTMTVPESAVKEISRQESVKRVSYDPEVTTSETSRTLTANDWNNQMIGSFDAWDDGFTGDGVKVAVIDTGFAPHPDITYAGGHSIFDGKGEDALSADPYTNDHDGHGTHVAGIIAAAVNSPVRGIAPGVELYGIKVFHKTKGNSTSASNLMEGVQWAYENGMDVINISSGYNTDNQEYHDLFKAVVDAGITVVAASGNKSDANPTIDYPAAYPEVIAVSSVGEDTQIAHDAMISPKNELVAPGQSIYGLNTSGGYQTLSGSSQATPHVSGLVAILKQKYKTLTAGQIRTKLQESAMDLGADGKDSTYGYGLVQYPSEKEDSADSGEDETGSETPGNSQETPEENTDNEPSNDQDETDTEEETSENQPETKPDPSENNPVEEKPEESPETEQPQTEPEQEAGVSVDTVWVRPTEREGMAALNDEDLAAVADNGSLAVSFDYSMSSLTDLQLSEKQVQEVKARNLTIMVAKPEVEWVIPASNFKQGTATIRVTDNPSMETAQAQTASSALYQFELFVNGQPVNEMNAEMTYRFFADSATSDQHRLYRWNSTDQQWSELSSTYSKGAFVGTLNQTGILGIFSPAAFAAATAEGNETTEEELKEKTEKDPSEAEEDKAEESDKETEEKVEAEEADPSDIVEAAEQASSESASNETETAQAGVSETTDIPSPLLITGVVALLSFGGGFYFFGKSK
ncbi:S8 family peptidase [Marinilactibacillus piezotolerans]|uniref:S8 family peptidase n=1 Tax=Marinilactibacillus piezotolerans TaxID=258723 RepID=UPI0015C4161E|nr:S8 family peptidase [Marinilactibacillus piezotolerans]